MPFAVLTDTVDYTALCSTIHQIAVGVGLLRELYVRAAYEYMPL